MYQKVTITLPKKTVDKLNKRVKKGQKSKFIYEAIEEKLWDDTFIMKDAPMKDPFDDALEFAKKLNLNLTTDQILRDIERGRM